MILLISRLSVKILQQYCHLGLAIGSREHLVEKVNELHLMNLNII